MKNNKLNTPAARKAYAVDYAKTVFGKPANTGAAERAQYARDAARRMMENSKKETEPKPMGIAARLKRIQDMANTGTKKRK